MCVRTTKWCQRGGCSVSREILLCALPPPTRLLRSLSVGRGGVTGGRRSLRRGAGASRGPPETYGSCCWWGEVPVNKFCHYIVGSMTTRTRREKLIMKRIRCVLCCSMFIDDCWPLSWVHVVYTIFTRFRFSVGPPAWSVCFLYGVLEF